MTTEDKHSHSGDSRYSDRYSDEQLSALYRLKATEGESSPPTLDRAVLAQAAEKAQQLKAKQLYAATNKGPLLSQWSGQWPSQWITLATTGCVFAITIMTLLRTPQGELPLPTSQPPAIQAETELRSMESTAPKAILMDAGPLAPESDSGLRVEETIIRANKKSKSLQRAPITGKLEEVIVTSESSSLADDRGDMSSEATAGAPTKSGAMKPSTELASPSAAEAPQRRQQSFDAEAPQFLQQEENKGAQTLERRRLYKERSLTADAVASKAPEEMATEAAAAEPEATKKSKLQKKPQGISVDQLTPATAESFLVQINTLLEQGQNDKALKAFRDFQRQYPYYPIAPEMLNKLRELEPTAPLTP